MLSHQCPMPTSTPSHPWAQRRPPSSSSTAFTSGQRDRRGVGNKTKDFDLRTRKFLKAHSSNAIRRDAEGAYQRKKAKEGYDCCSGTQGFYGTRDRAGSSGADLIFSISSLLLSDCIVPAPNTSEASSYSNYRKRKPSWARRRSPQGTRRSLIFELGPSFSRSKAFSRTRYLVVSLYVCPRAVVL